MTYRNVPSNSHLYTLQARLDRLAREVRRELWQRREGHAPRSMAEIQAAADGVHRRAVGDREQALLLAAASAGEAKR